MVGGCIALLPTNFGRKRVDVLGVTFALIVDMQYILVQVAGQRDV